jgi:hypothetical protein
MRTSGIFEAAFVRDWQLARGLRIPARAFRRCPLLFRRCIRNLTVAKSAAGSIIGECFARKRMMVTVAKVLRPDLSRRAGLHER